jgi:hypothetical protein
LGGDKMMLTVMDFVYAVLLLCGAIIFIANCIMIIEAGIGGPARVDEFLNPKTLYKNHKVNRFGCIMLTIFYHIVFCIHAIWFWFYKLCTFGRRQDDE